MNCLEYRRRLTIDPRSHNAELCAHAQSCAACTAFRQRVQKLEDRLHQSLAIDPPSGLTSRIMLRQTTRQSQQSHRHLLAFAASVTLVVGMALGGLLLSPQQPLDQVVLAHVNDEIDHLYEDHKVSMQQLDTAMAAVGGAMRHPVTRIRYASNCPIRKHKGVHVIMDGKTGPVTVLVMPGETVQHREHLGDQRFRGLIVPVANGSIAIVGEKSEDVDALESRVLESFEILT